MKLLFFIIGLVLYFVLHSVLASTKVKAFLIDRLIPEKSYRLIYNLLALILLYPIALLYTAIEINYLFKNMLLQGIGIIISVAGFFLFILALRQYNLSEFAGTQQLTHGKSLIPASLNTSGVNSIVRHPLYLASLMLIWGWFLFQSTIMVLIIALIISLYLYFGTKLEEKKLVKAFGEAYKQYQKEVPMILPFCKGK